MRQNPVVFLTVLLPPVRECKSCLNLSFAEGREVTEMCEESSRSVQSGHLVSPQYPDVYPANTNCLCRLELDRPTARLQLTFYDLALETRNGRCQADWIMLRQKGQTTVTNATVIFSTRN